MQTQITCPRCRTPFVAEVYQVVDVGREPALKELMLAGMLNVAQCPACQAVTQVASPLLYHDPEHQLFMVYVPIEMGLRHADQERLIGQLVQRAIDSLPPESRRGYMLQPQTMLTYDSLLERVMESAGITKEDVARQQEQASFLGELLNAEGDQVDTLLAEKGDLVDGAFFIMFRSLMAEAESTTEEAQFLKLINLQARLYQKTAFGQKLEQQQRALHAFSRDAKKEGGVAPKLLLRHILDNREDDEVVAALVDAGLPAFDYQFFLLLSERIEKRKKAGANVTDLEQLREKLLQLQEAIARRSRKMLEQVEGVLREILTAADREKAVAANLYRIDESFLYFLSAALAQAEQRGDTRQVADLHEVRHLVMREVEKQAPPAIQLLNQLLRAENGDELERILDENGQMLSGELVDLVQALQKETQGGDNPELQSRLENLLGLLQRRMAA
jgi:hypothetical protein